MVVKELLKVHLSFSRISFDRIQKHLEIMRPNLKLTNYREADDLLLPC